MAALFLLFAFQDVESWRSIINPPADLLSPEIVSILRVVVSGLVLGVVVGKLIADRPEHLKRLLPKQWIAATRGMKRKQWVRLIDAGLLVMAAALVITMTVTNLLTQANVPLYNPEEFVFESIQREFPLLLLILVNVLPIFEEWVFRGIIIDEVMRWKGSKVLAIGLSSVIFAMFHLSNPGTYIAYALVLLPSSVLLGLCYMKVGLGGAILAHNAYNSFLVIVPLLT